MREAFSKTLQLGLIITAGLIGALAARGLGWPIPFLLGSMTITAVISLTLYARRGTRLWYPPVLRTIFIAIIGVMIGSTFSPEIFSLAGKLVITLSAMIVFIALAQLLNFGVFRYLGRYDRITALYAAMPGGLIEAVTLGEKAGGDVETLSLQHFVRIVLVILIIPALFLVFTGEAVGSAAGQTLQASPASWKDWLTIFALVPLGIWLGNLLRLPAGHLIGPLMLVAMLHGLGVLQVQGPELLLNTAQLIVGVGLGTRFARSTPRALLSALSLGLVSVLATIALGAVFALVLSGWLPISFATLLISFAPGGVTEMSLVALSLGISPILITTHHLFRILFTVSVAGVLTSRRTKIRPTV